MFNKVNEFLYLLSSPSATTRVLFPSHDASDSLVKHVRATA